MPKEKSPGKPTTRRYSAEEKAAAVRMVRTLGWVHWHNTSRRHGYLGDVPPAEFKATFYATNRNDQTLVEIQ